jgi:hypothetical protein
MATSKKYFLLEVANIIGAIESSLASQGAF